MDDKRIGRPPIQGEAMDRVFQLRLSEAERESYEAAAKRAGKSLSAWIRERLNRAAKR
jgi:predicted HicB family RNase H-like nuclease